MSPVTPPTPPANVLREAAKVVVDVLQAELVLDDPHCLLGDQEWTIPADRSLFVVVYDDRGKPVGGANALDSDPTSGTVGQEIQQSAVFHDIRIEMMSFDGSARARKEEVGLALQSFNADALGERWGVRIHRPSEAVNASDSEGPQRLQKFVTHVRVAQLHEKVKTPGAGIFTKFNGATTDGTSLPPQTNTEP